MLSATSDRQDVDSVSDPVSAETCEEGGSGAFKPGHHETPLGHGQRTEQEAGRSERNS